MKHVHLNIRGLYYRASTRVLSTSEFEAVKPYQLLIIGLCFFFNILDGFDITAMAVVAGSVSAELALSPDQLGWIFSFALAGMMGGAMFLAPLSDKYGRRTIIIASILLLAVAVLQTARATTLVEFVLLRFVAGLAAGSMLATQSALTAEFSPDKYRALTVGVVASGYSVGAMMTSVAADLIMPEFGWRGMFWFGGGITLGLVALAWLFVPESIKFLLQRRPDDALQKINGIHRKLGKQAFATLPAAGADDENVTEGVAPAMLSLLSIKFRTRTLMLWTTFFLSFATLYFLMSWIPKLMENAGYTAAVGRQAFFAFNLGGVIGVFLMGALSIRYKLSNIIFTMLLGASIGMLLFWFAQDAELSVVLVAIFVIGAFQTGGFVGLYGAAAKSYPTKIRSTGIGWAIGLGRSGAVAGPAVAGYLVLAGASMSASFVLFAIPLAFAAFFAYRMRIH